MACPYAIHINTELLTWGQKVDLRVSVEFHGHTHLLQRLSRLLSKLVLDNLISVAVRHKQRGLLVRPALREKLLELVAQRKIARQGEDAAEFLRGREPREKGHRAALGEASEDDSGGGDALVHLFSDHAVEYLPGSKEAGFVLVSVEFFNCSLVRCQKDMKIRELDEGKGRLTVTERFLMSYQPGMDMPMFYRSTVSLHIQESNTLDSNGT